MAKLFAVIFSIKKQYPETKVRSYMSDYKTKIEKLSLPLVALSSTVAFPGEIVNLEVSDTFYGSGDALKEAFEGSKYVFAVPIKTESPSSAPELFDVGTVVKIKQLVNSGEKSLRCIVEGMSRATLGEVKRTGKYYTADIICKTVSIPDTPGIKNQAYNRRLIDAATKMARLLPPPAETILSSVKGVKNPAMLADVIASGLFIKFEDKLEILSIFEP